MKLIPVLIALIALILATWVLLPTSLPLEQRGYICNTIERAPDTIKRDLDLCRKGLTKEVLK